MSCPLAFRAQCAFLALAGLQVDAAQSATWGYAEKVKVRQETRLDWTYAVLGKSLQDPPQDLLGEYHSARQRYEFYGPRVAEPGRTYPLVLFVSPTRGAMGWKYWQVGCRTHQVLFAGPRDTGNGKPAAYRIRALLDVLDDVRRRYAIDADRTYVSGFSGGAAIACRTAFRLPEYFGGVVCIGNSQTPSRTPGLFHRIRDRLSLAIICGAREPSASLAELRDGPWCAGAGIRSRVVLVPRLGHKMPSAELLEKSYRWLEDGVGERKKRAATYAAARIPDAPTQQQWAVRLLDEARARLEDPTTIASGVSQLRWISQRWSDLPQSREAQKLLDEVEAREDRPWEEAFAEEDRRLRLLDAEGLHRVATARLRSSLSHRRGQYARAAIAAWQRLYDESKDEAFRQDAQRRLAELKKISTARPPREGPTPLRNVRFKMTGEVSVREGLERLGASLRALGYRLEIDEQAISGAQIDLDRRLSLSLGAVPLERAFRALLRPVGLKAQRRGESIHIVPREPATPTTD